MRRLFVIATALTLMLVPVTAGASEHENPVQIGLGDSVAWGFGSSNPATDGYQPQVNRFADAIYCGQPTYLGCSDVDLVDLSVPGATSSSLIANQLQPALELIGLRNSDASADNDVKLVTVTIGGNDLFNPVVAACAAGITPECEAVIAEGFATYTANLGVILGSLRAAAGPGTDIAIMTYYNPLGSCFLADLAPLADLVLEGGGPLPLGLNDIIRGVAAATGATVVETYGALGPDDFVGGDDCLHPDDSGYKKIARAFVATLR